MITTYKFTFPKNNDNKYKNSLADKVLNAYPWLGGKKKNKTTFDFCLHDSHSKPNDKYYTADNFNTDDLEKEFFNIISTMSPLAKDYDFEDEFGTPIRIFDNFVQIGYDIIPIIPGSLNHLKPKTKKTIIDIVIKIKNSSLF